MIIQDQRYDPIGSYYLIDRPGYIPLSRPLVGHLYIDICNDMSLYLCVGWCITLLIPTLVYFGNCTCNTVSIHLYPYYYNFSIQLSIHRLMSVGVNARKPRPTLLNRSLRFG